MPTGTTYDEEKSQIIASPNFDINHREPESLTQQPQSAI